MPRLILDIWLDKSMFSSALYCVSLAKELNCNVTFLITIQDSKDSEDKSYEDTKSKNQENIKKIIAADFFVKNIIARLKVHTYNLPEINVKIKSGDKLRIFQDEIFSDNPIAVIPGIDFSHFLDYIEKDIFNLANNIRCPVLIVPPKFEFKKLHTILFATDYTKIDIDILFKFIQLFNTVKPLIYGLHVTDNFAGIDKSKAKKIENKIIKETGYNKFEVIGQKGKKVASSLDYFAQKVDVDLIAVLKNETSGLENLFSTNESDRIDNSFVKPVLLL